MARKAIQKERFHGDVVVGRNECGKFAYGSRKQARHGRKRIPGGESRRAYRCEHCGLFHNGRQSHEVRRGEVSAADWYARKPRRAA